MLQDATNNEIKQAKSIDPVWKTLRITRILYSLWLIILLIFIFFMVKDQGVGASLPIIIIFPLIYGIFPMVTQLLQERYWNTIAQQRAQALYHREALLSSVLSRPTANKSELQLPLHIQLRHGGKMRLLLIIFLLIMVIIGVAFGLISSGGNKPFHPGPMLIVLGSIIAGVLILFVLILFIQAQYFAQTFDITEEGITTRYKFQRRSIRWDEVRVFARYTPHGWNAATTGNIYELTNEQTVVRWAQRPSFGIVARSNRPEYDDVNWLMGQINTLAMARSGKPLLNLDQQSLKRRSKSMQTMEMATLQNVPPLGEDDPIISKIKAGSSKKPPLFLGAFGIGMILLGALLQYSSHDKSLFTGSLMFRYGIFILLLALLTWLLVPMTQRYWLNIQRRRQSALQHPEHGLAAPQPGPTQEQPQPQRLYISMVTNSTSRAFKLFGFLFITFLAVIELVVFSLNPLYQLAMLIGSVLLTGVSVLFGKLMRNKSTMQRIDVNTNGISSHYILNDTQINWQDARLFATYKSLTPLNIGTPIQIYELVGEQAVVRWSRQSVTIRTITTEPAMNVEEYERWLQQLHGYISERTQLPLHDLDKVEVPSIQ